jgi:anti-sigma B factor antagonist
MKVERNRVQDVTILKFVGEFDAFNLPTYSQKIDALCEGGESSLVFNLHLLTFINSSALGYLLKVKKRAQELGGDLVLVQPSKFIRKTLLTLGLQEVFAIYESDEDGVLSFLKPGGGKRSKLEAGGETDDTLTGANAIMFSVVDEEGKSLYGDKRQVGRVGKLTENSIEFTWQVPPPGNKFLVPISKENFDAAFHPGTRLRVKFRQPFAMKSYYFELSGLLSKASMGGNPEAPDEAHFLLDYQDIKDEDRAALSAYLKDLEAFRSHFKKGGDQL